MPSDNICRAVIRPRGSCHETLRSLVMARARVVRGKAVGAGFLMQIMAVTSMSSRGMVHGPTFLISWRDSRDLSDPIAGLCRRLVRDRRRQSTNSHK